MVYFLGYNTSAKFELHCTFICRGILHFVLWHPSMPTLWDQLSYLHNTKLRISLKRQKISQIKKHHSSPLWNAFPILLNLFFMSNTLRSILKTDSVVKCISVSPVASNVSTVPRYQRIQQLVICNFYSHRWCISSKPINRQFIITKTIHKKDMQERCDSIADIYPEAYEIFTANETI